MLQYGIARFELQRPRDFPDPQNDLALENRANPSRTKLARADGIFILGLIELSGTMMSTPRASATSSAMTLKLPFALGLPECQTELVEVSFGKLELLEETFPDPATAIVRSKFEIFDHQHASFRFRVYDLAAGHQDAEVRDCRLRPLLEAFGDQRLMRSIAIVVFAVLGRTWMLRPFCRQCHCVKPRSLHSPRSPLQNRREVRWEH